MARAKHSSEKKEVTKKLARPRAKKPDIVPRNIEAIWRKQILGEKPINYESIAEIVKWVYEVTPKDRHKALAFDLMERGYRGAVPPQ